MDDLIARLSAGERWDGDNAEVLRALGFERVEKLARSTMTRDAFDYWIKGDKHVADCRPLDSVVAALRLVGNGWGFSRAQYDEECGVLRVWLWNAEKYDKAFGKCTNHNRVKAFCAALTIAILEAGRG